MVLKQYGSGTNSNLRKSRPDPDPDFGLQCEVELDGRDLEVFVLIEIVVAVGRRDVDLEPDVEEEIFVLGCDEVTDCDVGNDFKELLERD